jgi:methionyl-tRNA formyltransferase
MASMRLAVLCADDPQHHYLVAHLQSRFNVVGVVVEPEASQRKRLFKCRRYRDYIYAEYHHFRTTVFRESGHYFSDVPTVRNSFSTRHLRVDDINDRIVISFLKEVNPDVTILDCTSVLNSDTLAAAGRIVLNIHGGYLPDYRGIHSMFWPLYRGDFSKLAATIHFVDCGIDTGSIVKRVIPPIRSSDTAETIYGRAERMAIACLINLLVDYEEGEELPRIPQHFRGRLYKQRDRKPYHDVIYWIRRRTGWLDTQLEAAEYLKKENGQWMLKT